MPVQPPLRRSKGAGKSHSCGQRRSATGRSFIGQRWRKRRNQVREQALWCCRGARQCHAQRRAARVRLAARALRIRQDHAAGPARRLHPADIGSIHFGERDVTLEPPHKRNIGVVFQNYALFPHMSVGENVAFPLRARRLPKADWPAKVARRAGNGRPRRLRGTRRGAALRRPAPARGAGARDDIRAAVDPDGRATLRARQAAAGKMQIELRQLHKRSAPPSSTSPTTSARR